MLFLVVWLWLSLSVVAILILVSEIIEGFIEGLGFFIFKLAPFSVRDGHTQGLSALTTSQIIAECRRKGLTMVVSSSYSDERLDELFPIPPSVTLRKFSVRRGLSKKDFRLPIKYLWAKLADGITLRERLILELECKDVNGGRPFYDDSITLCSSPLGHESHIPTITSKGFAMTIGLWSDNSHQGLGMGLATALWAPLPFDQ